MAIGDIPTLYVEGRSDIGVVNALLKRHGIDTLKGSQHLVIKSLENDEGILDNIPDVVRGSTDHPVGFVIDIDIEVVNRWAAIAGKLREINFVVPKTCPPTGFLGKLPSYRHRFGFWLMPDCVTDCAKIEHLIQSLMPANHPLWPHAQGAVAKAAEIIDQANATFVTAPPWKRFREVDRIKSEVHSWISWQTKPGVPLGAAIADHILGHDSPQAIAFLRWLKELYGFQQLNLPAA